MFTLLSVITNQPYGNTDKPRNMKEFVYRGLRITIRVVSYGTYKAVGENGKTALINDSEAFDYCDYTDADVQELAWEKRTTRKVAKEIIQSAKRVIYNKIMSKLY